MSSKNNPEMRGAVTEFRKFKNKTVKPCQIIDSDNGVNIIGAVYESGEIVYYEGTKKPIPYQAIYG